MGLIQNTWSSAKSNKVGGKVYKAVKWLAEEMGWFSGYSINYSNDNVYLTVFGKTVSLPIRDVKDKRITEIKNMFGNLIQPRLGN